MQVDGAKLEQLMKAFLLTDPTFRDQFSDVWLWGEWPGHGGKHDSGAAPPQKGSK